MGNEQKKGVFWARIYEHFNDHYFAGCTKARPSLNMESNWSNINYEVSRFTVAYKHVVGLNTSSTSLKDTFVKAKELFQANHPKDKVFGFQYCWNVLKDIPKW